MFTVFDPRVQGSGVRVEALARDAGLGHCRGRHRGPGLSLGAAPKIEELQARPRLKLSRRPRGDDTGPGWVTPDRAGA